METENRAVTKRTTWLVVGILVLATIIIVVSRRSPDESTDLLRQEGIPAARQGMALSQEGKKLLSLEEQHEMDAIYAEAFKALTTDERQRFEELAQQGVHSTDSEIAETAQLLEKALLSLPTERGARLWDLVSKAVTLAQEQSPATTDSE
jgi:hypothetical protein